jgi:hypothetical protein
MIMMIIIHVGDIICMDIYSNAYITDRHNAQMKLRASDIVALANAKAPPAPPERPTLVEAHAHSLTVSTCVAIDISYHDATQVDINISRSIL